MNDVQIRQVVRTDGPLVRELRLEALADTPIGYLETLEQARTLDDAAWTARVVRGSAEGDSHQVLAWDGGQPVGTMVAFEDDAAGWLAAVYVTPTARGTGVLGRMLEPCARWSRERGLAELRLEVHEDNARAIAAYLRLGFVPTGERRPYPLDPTRDELVMTLRLT